MERVRRLRKGKEFNSVYEKGTVVSGPLFVLRLAPSGKDGSRWGFAVGKRISKHAVVRNRLRRRLREAARQLCVANGWDVIVTARAGAMQASYATLCQELEQSLQRANVLAGSEPP